MREKIALKEPTLDDLEFIQSLWADPETMAQVGGPINLEDQEARDWYARMISPGSPVDCYRLILDQKGTPVGEVSCHRLHQETMTADLNIKIAARYRGKGYARQALDLFLDHFFFVLGGRTILDKVAKGNQDGKRFLLAFGFREDISCDEYDLLILRKRDFLENRWPVL